jgi:hypothetical protein
MVAMTLPVDTRRAFRTLPEQQLLIQSIVAAPASEQETEWLEWKTDVDLATKAWQATTARHTLGFANRHPDSAAAWCEGCAYIVLGAAPGSLPGTRVYDISKLNAWLSSYLGAVPDSPQWSATYVEVESTQVLLITVEKPRWGDPIWTVRKAYMPPKPETPMRAGTIYVRRQGSTEQADPGEVRMLTSRAGSGPRRLSLSLHIPEGEHAIPIDTGEALIKRWIAAERTALGAPQRLTTRQESAPASIGVSLAESLSAVQEAVMASAFLRETRTAEAFKAEVNAYLAKAKDAIPAAMRRGAVRHKLGKIHFWLDNETEHNFSQVVVEVSFEQPNAMASFDQRGVKGPELPDRPAPWGSHDLSRVLSRPLFDVRGPMMSMNVPHRPRGTIDNTGSTRIRFAPVDVRPGHSHRLETIYLIVGTEHAGELIRGTWLATAADSSGVARGDIDVPVSRDVPDFRELLSAPTRDTDVSDD